MRLDDLRTLTYRALEELGKRIDNETPGAVKALFLTARENGLLNFEDKDDGSMRVFPLATKPPTQIAGVEGIDAHRGMGDPT